LLVYVSRILTDTTKNTSKEVRRSRYHLVQLCSDIKTLTVTPTVMDFLCYISV